MSRGCRTSYWGLSKYIGQGAGCRGAPRQTEAQRSSNALSCLSAAAGEQRTADATRKPSAPLHAALRCAALHLCCLQGGNSSSGLAAAEDGSGAVWTGELIVEVRGQLQPVEECISAEQPPSNVDAHCLPQTSQH